MVVTSLARWWIAQETRALLTRLDRVRPFVLNMPMTPAAAVSPAALAAIESHLSQGRFRLRRLARRFLRWLHGPGRRAAASVCQRAFSLLKLRFNSVMSQFDIFADVLSQRSEHETGTWVAGLDDAAADALEIPGYTDRAPPVICYVTRGHGAAIRRARTRLPGGDANPVAIISIPRERMVGSGIAASLVHEVGHQGAALLGLVESLRPRILLEMERRPRAERPAWQLYARWISEIVADFWSSARLGVGSTMGLMGVVSLPRAFVFRFDPSDPHPIPWIRALLSCAMGNALYPHAQWKRLAAIWHQFYPLAGLDAPRRGLLSLLNATMPRFVQLLITHRSQRLRNRPLGEVLGLRNRRPELLLEVYLRTRASLPSLKALPPTLAFAVLSQARASGLMTPERESAIAGYLLTHWAARSAMDANIICGAQPLRRRRSPNYANLVS